MNKTSKKHRPTPKLEIYERVTEIVLKRLEEGVAAAYLSSWLKVLKVKENRRWIVESASQAQKASELVQGSQRPSP